MVFKTRKIPRHLIIEDEYDFRDKPRKGVFSKVVLWGFILALAYLAGLALLKI